MATKKNASRGEGRKILPYSFIFALLFVALLLILSSVVLEMSQESAPEPHTVEHWFYDIKTWISLLKELGFASLIAFIVSITVESRARVEIKKSLQDHNQYVDNALATYISDNEQMLISKVDSIQSHADAFKKSISREVFEAVLGRSFPAGYATGVVACSLDVNTVRKFYKTELCITEFSSENVRKYGALLEGKVKLKVRSSYDLLNVTETEQAVDVRVSFSHITQQGLEQLAVLENITIEHVDVDQASMEQCRIDRDDRFYKTYVFPRKIGPNGSLHVSLVYSLVKEFSDTEIWTSIFPTVEADVDVIVEVPDLQCGLRALNHKPAKMKGSNLPQGIGEFRWRLLGPLLPYQGFVFWWRPLPKDGLLEERLA